MKSQGARAGLGLGLADLLQDWPNEHPTVTNQQQNYFRIYAQCQHLLQNH